MYIRLCTWFYMLQLFSATFNPASTRSVSWFWAEGSRRMSSVDARGHPLKYLDVLLDLFWLHGLSLESEPPWLCLVTTLRRSMPRPSLPKIAHLRSAEYLMFLAWYSDKRDRSNVALETAGTLDFAVCRPQGIQMLNVP